MITVYYIYHIYIYGYKPLSYVEYAFISFLWNVNKLLQFTILILWLLNV